MSQNNKLGNFKKAHDEYRRHHFEVHVIFENIVFSDWLTNAYAFHFNKFFSIQNSTISILIAPWCYHGPKAQNFNRQIVQIYQMWQWNYVLLSNVMSTTNANNKRKMANIAMHLSNSCFKCFAPNYIEFHTLNICPSTSLYNDEWNGMHDLSNRIWIGIGWKKRPINLAVMSILSAHTILSIHT